MTQQWYPQRNNLDSLTATLKTFIHHLKLPISRQTIDDATSVIQQGLNWNAETVIKLLMTWGITAQSRPVTLDQLDSIQFPALGFLLEGQQAVPVVLVEQERQTLAYVHPRKGWVFEENHEFGRKWTKEIISVSAIQGTGETDFAVREKEYQNRINDQNGLQVAKWFSGVLSDEECDYIIRLSNDRFGRSKIGDQETANEGRTSYSAYLVIDDDPVLNSIRDRIAAGIGIATSHFEYFQCVSYEIGQEYQAHYDTFDPGTASGKEALKDGGQRAWTMLLYLNDDFVGGQTYFPKLDLLATPEKGCAVMFRNIDAQGRILPESLHAGLPVSKGKKYALNLWIRQEPTNNEV